MLIFIVESEFQFRLARANKAKSDIIVNLTGKKILTKIFLIFLFLIKYRAQETKFVAADHRSIATLILAMMNMFLKINIFVMEDGFHTLLVDEYGSKHLFWNCSKLKGILIRLLKKKILELNRFTAIDEYCKKLIQEKEIAEGYVFFVDQPNLTPHNHIDAVRSISKRLKKPLVVLWHPRSNNVSGQSVLSLGSNDEALRYKNSTFYGYCSTLLLLAVSLEHDVNLILLNTKDEISEQLHVYITDIQNLMIKRYPEKIQGVMI